MPVDKALGASTGTLYVVATPLGNLGDMSPRAVETLGAVDLILAEDTRVSSVLLKRYNITAPMVSYHKFNEQARAGDILRRVKEGQSCALITDAGTPCISDPGGILTGLAVAEGIPVVGVPGPCAAVLALSVSGFHIASYAFYGFPPRSGLEDALLALGKDTPNTAVFYESPNRIEGTVAAIGRVFPQAELCLCNDLTKRFELIYRGGAGQVLQALSENPSAHKGEYTLVVNKNYREETRPEETPSLEAGIVDIMAKEGLTLKEAVTALHERLRDVSKKDIYAASLSLKNLFKNSL